MCLALYPSQLFFDDTCLMLFDRGEVKFVSLLKKGLSGLAFLKGASYMI